jgi:hypothetical protein
VIIKKPMRIPASASRGSGAAKKGGGNFMSSIGIAFARVAASPSKPRGAVSATQAFSLK